MNGEYDIWIRSIGKVGTLGNHIIKNYYELSVKLGHGKADTGIVLHFGLHAYGGQTIAWGSYRKVKMWESANNGISAFWHQQLIRK